jgi:hypothetical protein
MLKEKKGILTDACFEEYLKNHKYVSDKGDNILFSHFGIFSQDLTNSISDSVEEMMFSSGDKKSIIKRVFSILIEGLQNIRIHSSPDDKNFHLSHLIVSKNDERYRISLGNITVTTCKNKLLNQITDLNNRSELEVKALYLDVLANGELSDKGGAGLGFITMKMKADTPLDLQFKEIADDKYYFSVSMELNRGE